MGGGAVVCGITYKYNGWIRSVWVPDFSVCPFGLAAKMTRVDLASLGPVYRSQFFCLALIAPGMTYMGNLA